MRNLVSHLRNTTGDPKKYAPVLAYLLTPAAMTGYAFALWRLGADLEWTGDFFVADGIFSKWLVWLARAVAAQAAGHRLNGRSGDAAGA
jgi:hypothetical protein